MDLSIIIVNYKTQHLVIQCVYSILEFVKGINFEIIIVDNNSEDDTERKLREVYPELRWLQMGYNSGFGRANNKGIEIAKGEYILLLNSDTYIDYDVISQSLSTYIEKKITGLLTTKLLSLNNLQQYSASIAFPGIKEYFYANPLVIFFTRKRFKYSDIKQNSLQATHEKSGFVNWVTGAFVLFNRRVILENSLFDHDYFLYSEDVDWCYKLMKKGITHYYDNKEYVYHLNGGSSGSNIAREKQIFASELLFIRKHRGVFYYLAVCSVLKINFYIDSILARRSRIHLNEFSIGKNLVLNQFFSSILFYRFRKSNKYGYLKVE